MIGKVLGTDLVDRPSYGPCSRTRAQWRSMVGRLSARNKKHRDDCYGEKCAKDAPCHTFAGCYSGSSMQGHKSCSLERRAVVLSKRTAFKAGSSCADFSQSCKTLIAAHLLLVS